LHCVHAMMMQPNSIVSVTESGGHFHFFFHWFFLQCSGVQVYKCMVCVCVCAQVIDIGRI